MSEHQETLKQVVARIEASFVKIKNYGDKVDQFRISAGKQLAELQARIEAGEAGKGVRWWAWYAENFKNRTRRDAQRVIALARANDPEKAAEEERTKARDGMAAHRKRVAATNVSHGSDLPDDAAADERAAQWADEMLLRIEADCKEEDVDRELGFRELSYRLARALGFKVQWIPWSEEQIAATEAPSAKKRGRPPGSKSKPREAGPASEETSEPAPTGNDVDTEATAEKRKASAAAAEAALVAPDDGSIPEFLRRDPPEQPVQP